MAEQFLKLNVRLAVDNNVCLKITMPRFKLWMHFMIFSSAVLLSRGSFSSTISFSFVTFLCCWCYRHVTCGEYFFFLDLKPNLYYICHQSHAASAVPSLLPLVGNWYCFNNIVISLTDREYFVIFSFQIVFLPVKNRNV